MNRPTDQPDPAVSEDQATEAAGAEAEADSAEAPAEAEAASETESLRAELAALEEEQNATNNRLLRTAAELQNVRRRAAEEQQRRSASAKAAALRPMLEVLDDLQRALAAAEDAQNEEAEAGNAGTAFQSLHDGVEMVASKFERTLAGLGVEPIEAEGHPFDEAEHEAMMQQPAPEGTAPGTVLAEVRRGYRMEAGDEVRVLRHSRVVVASEGEAAPSGEAEENKSAEE